MAFFWPLTILTFATMLGGCQDTQVKNHSEQLPPPGFKTKPQIYFVFDSRNADFNLPNSQELRHQLNAHVEVFSSSDETLLKNKIRAFNARPSDILVAGAFSQPTQKTLTLIQHPQRKLSLILDASSKASPLSGASFAPNLVRLNRQKINASLTPLKDLLSQDFPTKKIAWKQAAPQPEPLLLEIDWTLWCQQALKSISSGSATNEGAAWKEISFASNVLKISLNPQLSNPEFKNKLSAPQHQELKKALESFRLSQLGNLP